MQIWTVSQDLNIQVINRFSLVRFFLSIVYFDLEPLIWCLRVLSKTNGLIEVLCTMYMCHCTSQDQYLYKSGSSQLSDVLLVIALCFFLPWEINNFNVQQEDCQQNS